ncbi:hypothetical protein [Paracandidimonas soli]|uniref:Uncharacterized protein n=1 Tax=Paracandidimonas soli TaxID=1917182 RepID=A0A4R3URD2_9BURK|nr:hypothetical protein [Paracandidimonas soli]TCU92564.1 hypothetical protein EV686_1141 [Paracandidimonas soli]
MLQQKYHLGFVLRKLLATDMNSPPHPPSQIDEIGHGKRRVHLRQRILRLMKDPIPGLRT